MILEYLTKKEFEDAGCELLKKAGFVVKRFSHNRRAPSGSIGFVDVLAIKQDHSWYLEVKFGNDQMSEKQIEFRDRLKEQAITHIHYREVRTMADFIKVARYVDF